jgi:hypothetical protein
MDDYNGEQYSLDEELGGFDVACIDTVKEEMGWLEVIGKKTKKNRMKHAACDINALECTKVKAIGKGRITIDSSAAESVLPRDMLHEIRLQESEGSKAGVQYVAANGGKMPNLGEKKVRFKTKNGMESNVVFQVTDARKPLASVAYRRS